MIHLSPSTSLARLIAWVLLSAFAAVVLYWSVGQPVALYLEGTAKLESLEEQTERYRHLAGQQEAYERDLESLEQSSLSWRPQYLRAGEPNLATAELQQLLTRSFRMQGIRADRMDIRPQAGDLGPDGVGVIAAQIQLTADYSLFLAALHDLEGMTPLLLLDDLALQPVLTRGTLRQPDARQVAVRLSVRALYLQAEVS